ncbi:hypothetical protein CIK04_29815 [Vibrio sp. 03_296]|nr:hypothetical protein CIK04_30575 [Vibrio sp. 03_296]OZT82121.1 hypothetical protein CIK04_29815 [Vibrio sp. 03_296]
MLPKQVHLRCVLLTSYCFLQTLPLASNALAIRIIFPSVRAIRASFNPTGLPASLGKQKRLANGKPQIDDEPRFLSGVLFWKRP